MKERSGLILAIVLGAVVLAIVGYYVWTRNMGNSDIMGGDVKGDIQKMKPRPNSPTLPEGGAIPGSPAPMKYGGR